jgi:hypothetical protein
MPSTRTGVRHGRGFRYEPDRLVSR